MNEQDREYEELPQAIVARLKARERGVALLTPRVDAAVARAAAEHFAGRAAAERPRIHRRWAIPAAAAAALLAAFVVFRLADFDAGGPALADDVDRSGQVDILDAFALARANARNGAASAAARGEVEALAARIVALSPPTGAQPTERVL